MILTMPISRLQMNDLSDNQLKNMLKESIEAAKNSYSPYSNYPVGAALLCEDGLIIKGRCSLFTCSQESLN